MTNSGEVDKISLNASLLSEIKMHPNSFEILGKASAVARPQQNFIELMNWAHTVFKDVLTKKSQINKFVHNKIIIDSNFIEYAKNNNISIQALLKDSVVSWNDDGVEKFFMQGVFLIKKDDIEFIVCSLYHKGNSFEDEVSFFVLVDNSSYEGYVSIRNDFEKFLLLKDRSNLKIRVVGGEDISYDKDISWDDVFLPDEMKKDIQGMVENFLKSKDFYEKNRIPWKKGLILFGGVGLGKTSIIKTIIANYNFKPVTIISEATEADVVEAFNYAEEQSPSLLYFEDLDSLLEKVDVSIFLNLMDGVKSRNGIFVIATANNIKTLKKSITERPSRFDRKIEIPLPDVTMAEKYIKKWFGKFLSDKKILELAKKTTEMKFSYAYLQELYLSSMFEAISENRERILDKDISKSLKKLKEDKNLLNNDFVNITNYLK